MQVISPSIVGADGLPCSLLGNCPRPPLIQVVCLPIMCLMSGHCLNQCGLIVNNFPVMSPSIIGCRWPEDAIHWVMDVVVDRQFLFTGQGILKWSAYLYNGNSYSSKDGLHIDMYPWFQDKNVTMQTLDGTISYPDATGGKTTINSKCVDLNKEVRDCFNLCHTGVSEIKDRIYLHLLSFVITMVPMRSLFPGKVLILKHGHPGPGKVLTFEYFR